MKNEGTLWLVDYEDWFKTESIGMIKNSARLFVEHLVAHFRDQLLQATGKGALERRTLPVPALPTDEESLQVYKGAVSGLLSEVDSKDKVLAFGQGYWKQKPLRLETRAANRFSSTGLKGPQLALVEAGHDLEMEKKRADFIRDLVVKGNPFLSQGMETSTDAGGYYCNALLYLMMKEGVNGDFFHLPVFTVGDEERAKVFFDSNQATFMETYSFSSANDFSFASNEDAARILVQFLEAERSGF